MRGMKRTTDDGSDGGRRKEAGSRQGKQTQHRNKKKTDQLQVTMITSYEEVLSLYMHYYTFVT